MLPGYEWPCGGVNAKDNLNIVVAEWRTVLFDIWCSCGAATKRLWRWWRGQQATRKNVSDKL